MLSKISQISQCIQKLIIVSLMQSNARLIQNIGYTYQSGTIWVARRILCASPPERVPVALARVR